MPRQIHNYGKPQPSMGFWVPGQTLQTFFLYISSHFDCITATTLFALEIDHKSVSFNPIGYHDHNLMLI